MRPASAPRKSSPSSAGPNHGSWFRRSGAKARGRSCWRCSRSSTACGRMRRTWRTPPRPGRPWATMQPETYARATKNPAEAGFFDIARDGGSGGLQRLDARGEAALVTGGLVLVDQAARAEAVEDRLGDGERGVGAGGVVGVDGLEHLLDGGAQHRALGGVAGIADDGLLGALLGGLDVGHDGILGDVEMGGGAGRQESMGDSATCVNGEADGKVRSAAR